MEGHESHSENNNGSSIKWEKITATDSVSDKTGKASGVVRPAGEEKNSRVNKFVFPFDLKSDKSHGAVSNVK